MAHSTLLKLACVLLACIVVAAPAARATVTCGQVSSALAPCISLCEERHRARASLLLQWDQVAQLGSSDHAGPPSHLQVLEIGLGKHLWP
ncbi:hypothetical protein NL676_018799 [Syzygium grande]|nr:hypothetical protein NL676_018799 [Syzygium grande]